MEQLNLKKLIPSDFGVTIRDENGTAIDLTDYDGVDFIMVDSDGVVKINGSGLFVLPKTSGKVTYNLAEEDVDTVGTYRAYFVLKKSGVKKLSAPTDYFTISIFDDML